MEFKPTSLGHIFVSYSYTENIHLPGLFIHFLKAPGKVEGDSPLYENLYVSQKARAFLENLQESRKRGEESKTLTLTEIEEKLEAIIRTRGDNGLNTLRDKAQSIAPFLGFEKEFKKLNQFISDLFFYSLLN